MLKLHSKVHIFYVEMINEFPKRLVRVVGQSKGRFLSGKGPFTKDVRAEGGGGEGGWKIRTNSDIGGRGGGLAIRMSEI